MSLCVVAKRKIYQDEIITGGDHRGSPPGFEDLLLFANGHIGL